MYMLELVRPDLRQTYNMIAQVMDNGSYIFIAFMLYVYKYGEATLVPFVLHSAFTIIVILLVPESPSY